MGQVVKFFGWLLIGIGGTLAVFSHLTMGFVYGWDKLAQQVTSDPTGTALSVLALVPGALLYGFGVFLEKWSIRSDAKWAAKQAAAKAKEAANDATPPHQTES
ncbi:hypothetical protein [Magnetovibrio sp.]|uniref:hypothetical protein n=1 Tax=Magnetovibrio sp. TaxID=2024836 RepID=UPI002F93E163